jgi:drug/metabolite transporter (DMT)-like permease
MLHQPSGHWRLGLTLSLITACLWGTMPNVLSVALQSIDTYTLTWFRFLSSFLLLGLYILIRQMVSRPKEFFDGMRLPRAQSSRFLLAGKFHRRSSWILLLIAILGVGLDYPLYLLGMAKTSPANSEVIIQFAPVLMGFGGIAIFKEHYTRRQWGGVAVLFAGFVLFFHEQLRTLVTASADYWWGSSLVLLAAVCWAAYALAQKQLLRELNSEMIMLIIYGTCAVLYTPFAKISTLFSLDIVSNCILVSCGFSTLISYGAFAESLQHWEASKISAVQSLTPIITITTSWLIAAFLPTLTPAQISLTGLAGAVLVIAGSMVIALLTRN